MPTFARRDLLATAAAASVWPLVSPMAQASQTSDLETLLATRIDIQKRGTGAALALMDAHRYTVLAHGRSSVEDARPPNDRSIFQIASLTKIFTALLFADAVRRGEVAADDPVDRYLNVIGPTFEGKPITLLDLATHSSGLPLRPASRQDRSQDDPYAGYSEADLHADFQAVRLTRAPGAAFEYSNFDYGLLGDALQHRLGRSYWELLEARILEPLDMHETKLELTSAMRRRQIQGYRPDMNPMRPWSFGALAPAGGLFSSLRDLRKFLALWLRDSSAPLAASARSMLTTERAGDDANTHMAIGWRVTRREGGGAIVWSNGSGGGTRSFMGFNLAAREGAIGFVNMATGAGVDDIATRALDASAPVDVSAPRVAITVSAAILDQYAGQYLYQPDDGLMIEHGADGLAIVQGPNRIPLFAETQTLFFVRDGDVTIEFASPIGGRSEALTLTQQGQSYHYARVR